MVCNAVSDQKYWVGTKVTPTLTLQQLPGGFRATGMQELKHGYPAAVPAEPERRFNGAGDTQPLRTKYFSFKYYFGTVGFTLFPSAQLCGYPGLLTLMVHHRADGTLVSLRSATRHTSSK